MQDKKKIYIISGPSGAGKSTLINMLLSERPNFGTVVSHTTRPIRESEINDQSYHFVSKNHFQDMIKNDEFIEYSHHFGNFYGTSKHALNSALSKHDSIVMDLTYTGADNIITSRPPLCEPIGILILPPSLKSLRSRLACRGSESDTTLSDRVHSSLARINNLPKYDHIIVNINLMPAFRQLLGVTS